MPNLTSYVTPSDINGQSGGKGGKGGDGIVANTTLELGGGVTANLAPNVGLWASADYHH